MVVHKKLQAGLIVATLIIFVIAGVAFLSPVTTGISKTKTAAKLEPGKLLFSQSIHEAYFSGNVLVRTLPANQAASLELVDSTGCVVDRMMFTEPLFQLRKGDLHRDGSDEIFLGIIKKTKFDPVVKKRMFIFYVDSLHLRPFFLSSKLNDEIVDFGVFRLKKNQVATIEKTSTSTFKIGLYAWLDFGFIFKGYQRTYNSLTACQRDFYHEIYQ